MKTMLIRAITALIVFLTGEEVLSVLIRLYAGEIIVGKITLEDVPAKLRDSVETYLREMGYPEE